MWTGKDVSYKHVKVFGCQAFVYIPKDKRIKLDGEAQSCIYLGNSQEQFSYKLRDLED